ncbi:MAG: flagellar biosynthesis anti-sigma factor FlgM [Ignavibacteriales bacterium]|nr:flagellar biosynthesis anti-sigma factor FlgM [Ignavibacteriales bacterium]
MEIKGISTNLFTAHKPKNIKTDSTSASEQRDKIVISTEARDLAKTEFSPDKIAELREKVNTGFYDSDEVLQKVVDKILNDILK